MGITKPSDLDHIDRIVVQVRKLYDTVIAEASNLGILPRLDIYEYIQSIIKYIFDAHPQFGIGGNQDTECVTMVMNLGIPYYEAAAMQAAAVGIALYDLEPYLGVISFMKLDNKITGFYWGIDKRDWSITINMVK